MSVISIPLRFAAGFDSKHRCDAQTGRGTRCKLTSRFLIMNTRSDQDHRACRIHVVRNRYGWWS